MRERTAQAVPSFRAATAAGAERERSPDSLARGGGLLLFVALSLVSVSGFAFHLIASRQLDPSAYGALGALLGVILVLAVPGGAIQVAITRHVAAHRREAPDGRVSVVAGPLLADAVVWSLVVGGALLLASPVLRTFLHLPSLGSAAMLAAFAVPATIGLVPKAVLLGQQRFRVLAVGMLAGAAVRLVLGWAFLRAGAGVDGAMAATVLAELTGDVVLLLALRSEVAPVTGVEPVRVRWGDASTAAVALTGFWLLASIDIVLARRYLPRSESGFYVAAATAARAALFLPGAIAMVALPRFAAAGPGHRGRTVLVQALAAAGLIGLVVTAVFLAAPDLVIETLFGTVYSSSAAVAGILAVTAACAGVTVILVNYHLAVGSRVASSLPWLGVAVAALGIPLAHSSMESVAFVALGANAVVLLAILWAAFATGPQPAEPLLDLVDEPLWRLPEPELDVTMVVPFYNPGPRLAANVERLVDVLERSGLTFEVIAVSDGSTDGSEHTLTEISHHVRCVVLPENQGKGQALRAGLVSGRGRYLGFIDADGDIDPVVLEPFLAIVQLYQPDIVLGSKRHPMSEVHYPPLRRVYSWGYQQLVRVLFSLKVRDTQTGLKLVRRDVLAEVLPRMLEKRFAFDLELLVVARLLGYRRLFEAPVRIRHQFRSTISPLSVRGMLLDTLAIFYRLRILRYYDSRLNTTAPSSVPLPL